jgi:hypothetical protein
MRRSMMMFSLGMLVGAAWGRRSAGGAAKRAPAPRPSTRAGKPMPAERPSQSPGLSPSLESQPGGERASVLGYERASPATPDPAAGQPSGAPGHRILGG